MNKITKYIITISLVFIVASTAVFASGQTETKEETMSEVQKAEYHKIDAETAKNIFDTQDDIIIIDVRTEGEYKSGHVENSINIPLDVITSTVTEQFPNKDEKLYVYCRSGNRSAQAAKLLVKAGYTNVYDFGGIISWPYKVVI
jgi:rhodanese-related sulfurtransferase